jgi:protein gp37
MGDLFMDEISPDKSMTFNQENPIAEIRISSTLKEWIYTIIRNCPRHSFVFLTKNPAGYQKWGKFPDNCWVGFSACNQEMLIAGLRVMQEVEARVKFVSIEPMLEEIWCLPSTLTVAGIKLVIIGAQSKPAKYPDISWVEAMVEIADKAKAMVFLKNNLGWPEYTADGSRPYYKETGGTWKLRQELPL